MANPLLDYNLFPPTGGTSFSGGSASQFIPPTSGYASPPAGMTVGARAAKKNKKKADKLPSHGDPGSTFVPFDPALAGGPGMGFPDIPRANDARNWTSSEDAMNWMANLGNQYWKTFGPLQGDVGNIYGDVLGGQIGDVRGRLIDPMVDPLMAAIDPLRHQQEGWIDQLANSLATGQLTQLASAGEHAERQMRDTMQGGSLQKGLGNVPLKMMEERAKAVRGANEMGLQAKIAADQPYSQAKLGMVQSKLPLQAGLLSGAMDMGSNAMARAIDPLQAMASLRLALKQINAQPSGGGKK